MKDDKYRPHIDKGGGMPKGYKFQVCPRCGKKGVTARVSRSKSGKIVAHRTCKYCNWFQVS